MNRDRPAASVYTEDELLPISALQHLVFCERQCALIHLEREWVENVLTLEGALLHRRVDVEARRVESRGEVTTVRAVALRSFELGLTGVADVVEFHRDEGGARVPGLRGRWRAQPVEYKRGRSKRGDEDRVQLCAQALALEEMLETTIAEGALFYGRVKRREPVTFDADLRAVTVRAARRLHEVISSGVTPRARREPKCRRCSLLPVCLPDVAKRSPVSDYLASLVEGG